MGNNMIFCENCRNDVDYSVKDVDFEKEYKGKTYKYIKKIAYCNTCGKEIFVPEIFDYNIDAFNRTYRESNGIITVDKIKEILEKYNIGKRPLSLLLGWGELTYTRYCDGDMPTKQYSEVLEHIYNDPRYYLELLESNRSNLKSKKAYNKSKVTVLDLLGENGKSIIFKISDYIINKCEITPLALEKALYYIQGFFYAFHGEFLFDYNCEAWSHGPVYPQIYAKYAEYKYNEIDDKEDCDEDSFTKEEKEIIDSVIDNICCYSAKVLESFTHKEIPWVEARGDLEENSSSKNVIEKEAIGNYFLSIKEKYNMKDPSDIKLYAKDMFEKR